MLARPCALTLRQLEVFLAAAQDCNFRRTARRLGVSQPTVSGRIRSVEAYLGYELFDRSSGSSPQLTPRGRAFVAKAQQLVSGATQLTASPKANGASAPLRLKIVIGPWLLTHRVMPALPAFCYENPSIVGEFEPIGLMTEGRELVGSGEADICLYTGDAPPDIGSRSRNTGDHGVLHLRCAGSAARVHGLRLKASPGSAVGHATGAPPCCCNGCARASRVSACRPRTSSCAHSFRIRRCRRCCKAEAFSVFFDEFVASTTLRRIGPPLQAATQSWSACSYLLSRRSAAAARTKCQNNLKQLGLGLDNYETQNGYYPWTGQPLKSSFYVPCCHFWNRVLCSNCTVVRSRTTAEFHTPTAIRRVPL